MKRNLNLGKVLEFHFLINIFTYFGLKNFETKLSKMINFINCENEYDLFNKMKSINSKPDFFLNKITIQKEPENIGKDSLFSMPDEEKFMLFDQTDYLPDDILCKVDRATMHNSIESRAPMLDHKLVEHSWRIPLKYKIKGSDLTLLRNEMILSSKKNAIKSGFGVPIDEMLRDSLRVWAEDTIFSSKKLLSYNKL